MSVPDSADGGPGRGGDPGPRRGRTTSPAVNRDPAPPSDGATLDSSSAVSVRGLTRVFGTETAVDGITFEVAQGELFGIVGPDGAGKTTTLRMLAGVLPPSSGEAEVFGVEVSRDPEGVKPFTAYMSQRFGLYEDLTVRENLDFYADLYRVPRAERPERLDRLFRFSHLREFEGRLAGALSGGMKQKLSLSCALIHHPKVLLLDEPTFGVDPISRRELWLILHEMVASGITVIVSTSYLDEAERCDRVALLDHGRLLALDTPTALQRRLPGRLMEVRVSSPREARDLLRQTAGVRGATLFGEHLHVLAESDEAWVGARGALEAAGVDVRETAVLEPSLEDVFIHLVAEPSRVAHAGAGDPGAASSETAGASAELPGVADAGVAPPEAPGPGPDPGTADPKPDPPGATRG